MNETAPLGIVTGLQFEAAIVNRWRHALGPNAPLVACVAGRADVAEQAAREMVERGVQGLVSFGIAGALDAPLKAGTLILPESVLSPGGRPQAVDQTWRDRLTSKLVSTIDVSTANLVTVSEPAASATAKRALHKSTGAGAVDMESWPIAKLAADRNLPFLAVRAIADEALEDLPGAALKAMQPDGSVSTLRVLAALASRPGQTGDLLRLGRHNKLARRTLARVARQGLPWFELI